MAMGEVGAGTDDSGSSFTFHVIESAFPSLQTVPMRDRLAKWNLQPTMVAKAFRFDQAFKPQQLDAFELLIAHAQRFWYTVAKHRQLRRLKLATAEQQKLWLVECTHKTQVLFLLSGVSHWFDLEPSELPFAHEETVLLGPSALRCRRDE